MKSLFVPSLATLAEPHALWSLHWRQKQQQQSSGASWSTDPHPKSSSQGITSLRKEEIGEINKLVVPADGSSTLKHFLFKHQFDFHRQNPTYPGHHSSIEARQLCIVIWDLFLHHPGKQNKTTKGRKSGIWNHIRSERIVVFSNCSGKMQFIH